MISKTSATHPGQQFLLTAAFALATCGAVLAFAQTAGAQEAAVSGTEERTAFTAAELEELVGPIALYPDDLVSIVLPASTFPLQVVQAARYLEDYENDSSLEPDEAWDDSIVALLNYPEVVALMNEDLDWTWSLGEAVLYQQTELLDAVQVFRNRAYAAGNLSTDDRQVVTEDAQTIVIQQADPEVIYVPYYNPRQVVVYQPYPAFHYYPRAYPVYYYPYSYGHSFASSFFWGVTTAFSIGWHSHFVNVHHYHHASHPYYGYSYHTPWYRRHSVSVSYGRNVWRPARHSGARPHDSAAVVRTNRTLGTRSTSGYRTDDDGRQRGSNRGTSTGTATRLTGNNRTGTAAAGTRDDGNRSSGNNRQGSTTTGTRNTGTRSSGGNRQGSAATRVTPSTNNRADDGNATARRTLDDNDRARISTTLSRNSRNSGTTGSSGTSTRSNSSRPTTTTRPNTATRPATRPNTTARPTTRQSSNGSRNTSRTANTAGQSATARGGTLGSVRSSPNSSSQARATQRSVSPSLGNQSRSGNQTARVSRQPTAVAPNRSSNSNRSVSPSRSTTSNRSASPSRGSFGGSARSSAPSASRSGGSSSGRSSSSSRSSSRSRSSPNSGSRSSSSSSSGSRGNSSSGSSGRTRR